MCMWYIVKSLPVKIDMQCCIGHKLMIKAIQNCMYASKCSCKLEIIYKNDIAKPIKSINEKKNEKNCSI